MGRSVDEATKAVFKLREAAVGFDATRVVRTCVPRSNARADVLERLLVFFGVDAE